jgi:hypothetical protein
MAVKRSMLKMQTLEMLEDGRNGDVNQDFSLHRPK